MSFKTVLDGLSGAFRHLSTPLLPDDYTHLVNPLWSRRELRGRIEKINRMTEDSVELVIKPGWGMPTNFKAGQFIGIGVDLGGRYVWRSYSLTNAPRPADGLLTITVKAIDEGYLSQHLVRHVKPGTLVRLAAPAGEFHLSEPLPPHLLFVTAGSGVTPVISMLRDISRRVRSYSPENQASNPPVEIVHIHSHRGETGAFEEELQKLADADHPGVNYTLHLWDTAVEKRLDCDEVMKLVPEARELAKYGAAYACGPSQLLDELEKAFPGIKTERFSLDRGATEAAGGTITFPGRGQITVDGATTILEASEQAGVQLPYGCRMGICATCVRQLADGQARDLRTGQTHEAGERIRTCVCVPAGDMALEP